MNDDEPLNKDNPLLHDDPMPDVPDDNLPADHQATDSYNSQDSHEIYDEGVSGAAEAGEPNEHLQSAVKDYNPSNNQ